MIKSSQILGKDYERVFNKLLNSTQDLNSFTIYISKDLPIYKLEFPPNFFTEDIDSQRIYVCIILVVNSSQFSDVASQLEITNLFSAMQGLNLVDLEAQGISPMPVVFLENDTDVLLSLSAVYRT